MNLNPNLRMIPNQISHKNVNRDVCENKIFLTLSDWSSFSLLRLLLLPIAYEIIDWK